MGYISGSKNMMELNYLGFTLRKSFRLITFLGVEFLLGEDVCERKGERKGEEEGGSWGGESGAL